LLAPEALLLWVRVGGLQRRVRRRVYARAWRGARILRSESVVGFVGTKRRVWRDWRVAVRRWKRPCRRARWWRRRAERIEQRSR
jgi:hypothetical protein